MVMVMVMVMVVRAGLVWLRAEMELGETPGEWSSNMKGGWRFSNKREDLSTLFLMGFGGQLD